MTAPITSWRDTIERRWRKSFSTSRAGACRRRRREPARPPFGDRAASDRRDDPALLVPAAVVVAATAGTAVLAGAADHHLGLSADLHRAERRVLCPGGRHPDRRGDPVGHPVSWPARGRDVVSRGDVVAQPRQPDDEPAKADRISDLA